MDSSPVVPSFVPWEMDMSNLRADHFTTSRLHESILSSSLFPSETSRPPMTNLYLLFPALEPYYFNVEKNFQMTFEPNLFYKMLPTLIVLAAFYLIAIFLGQKLMTRRQAFDLKPLLATWNLGLSIFSFMGAIRLMPHIGYSIYKYGLFFTLCENGIYQAGYGAAGFWCTMFVYSKVPELLDTAFIVLRKKNLSFLHYYHHITVMLFTCYGFSKMSPIGIYFIAINYTVHTVMYFYYFLTTLGYRPKWALMVTMLQLSQMVFGVVVSSYVHYLHYQQVRCLVTENTLKIGSFIYGTYFYLFLMFFINRFVLKKSSSVNVVPEKKTK